MVAWTRCEDRPVPWLGIRPERRRRRPDRHGLRRGPGQAGGLTAGDELLAIDGLRVRADNLDSLTTRLRPGRSTQIHIARDDELLVLDVEPASAPRDTCYLGVDPEASPEAVTRRRDWLGAEGATGAAVSGA